jgi:hypothetical protein
MIDYVRLSIGLLPLGLAFAVLAFLHMRRKPTVVTSGQEVLFLGFAISGFAMIGPMELFFPTASYAALGEWVWILLAALYFFLILLASMLSRSSLTVVGLEPEELQKAVGDALATEGLECRWLGDQLEVPELGIRAIVESSYGFRETSHLSPCGYKQNAMGWYQLEKLLRGKWRDIEKVRGVSRSSVSWVPILFLLLAGLCFFSSLLWILFEVERFEGFVLRIFR